MAYNILSKLSPSAGEFTPGAVQTPMTNTNGELQFTRSEFPAQKVEFSSLQGNHGGNYGDIDGGSYSDNYGGNYGVNYGDNYGGNYGESHYGENNYGEFGYGEIHHGVDGYGENYYGDKGYGVEGHGDNLHGNNNFGPSQHGADDKQYKGKKKNKSSKNKPQHQNQPTPQPQPFVQPAFYMDEETMSTMCEAKRKAIGEGMTLVCIGCGAFGKRYKYSSGHNWSSIMELDYSNYLNAPLCRFVDLDYSKKPYGGGRYAGKK